MAKKLTTNVHVIHPETGEIHHFGPGVDVPKWAVKAITNPDVWDDGEDDAADDAASAYKGLVKADLQAEIDKRNDGRDDDKKIVPASDKNGDLIAALEADDAASA